MVYDAAMPTRRIFELVVVTGVLLWPARATMRTWFKRQMAIHQEGDLMYDVGVVGVTVL